MFIKKLLFITCLSSLAMSSAIAQEASSFSANVALSTNYVFRGITQTDDGPAISGGFDWVEELFYAGVWASSVDFGDDTTLEIDWYGGVTPSIGETSFDFGVLYYSYPDSPDLPTGSQDFVEVYGGASRAFGIAELGASVAYSPEFYGETGAAFYIQGTAAVSLTERISTDVSVAQSTFDEDTNDDYLDYSVGVTVDAQGFEAGLRFHDTSDRTGGGDDDAVVFSLSRSF
ncbi:MAG: TorF family putative porin [Pseudomonadota bacterium]